MKIQLHRNMTISQLQDLMRYLQLGGYECYLVGTGSGEVMVEVKLI